MPAFNILRFESLESTNVYAVRHLDELDDRQIILAEIQTAGYGRLDRTWVSHVPDNIYISLVLKPDLPLDGNSPLANITQYMSLCICDVLDTYGVMGAIKWPNDVLVYGKKVCGLLSEVSIRDGRLAGYVLGTGINLNMPAEVLAEINQPATALNLITQLPVNREGFLSRLLERFFSGYEAFLEQGFRSIKERYTTLSPFLGTQTTVTLPDRALTGKAAAYDDRGRLQLVTSDGATETLTIGDVSLA
ncbi:MAG: biotin--[acetyl-CoA-carboxylase] ligase [Candidatus Latescibacteria bacterium]|jgi:BirA family biotin operon repressor/biotin-[acetyl-CoA-carboxylase] ligase|nr:biotin--[acetyl-CoA-carboxylase] ligase [Candidatus Latescibacterota bacterium]